MASDAWQVVSHCLLPSMTNCARFNSMMRTWHPLTPTLWLLRFGVKISRRSYFVYRNAPRTATWTSLLCSYIGKGLIVHRVERRDRHELFRGYHRVT